MSKKVSILEGQTSKHFSGVDFLRTDKQGGGTIDWVPEDARKRLTKTINQNGTYYAENEKDSNGKKTYYAYEKVTVNITKSGKVSGTKPVSGGGDGNEYSVGTDDSGNLTETVLPSSIRVVGDPTDTTYSDGEAINKAGMVVKAYLKDGTIYDYSGYQQGAIPLSELTIEPTTADISQVSGGALGYTSDLSISGVSYPIAAGWHVEAGGLGAKDPSSSFDVINSVKSTTYGSHSTEPRVNQWGESRGGWSISYIAASDSFVEDAVHIHSEQWTNYGNDHVVSDTYPDLSRTYTYQNKTVYYNYESFGMDAPYGNGFYSNGSQSGINAGSFNNDTIKQIAWAMVYGEEVGGGQTITVSWDRPEDGKTLTDTFNITVT